MAITWSPAQILQFGPLTPENLVKILTIGRVIASFNFASIVLMVWDTILTMPSEVRLLWGTRYSFLKIVFLVNRYVAPAVLGVNLYFMGGSYKGLNDSMYVSCSPRGEESANCDRSCRGWFFGGGVIQILCLGSISFLIAFRLWAWYETSTRTLYILLSVWATSLLVTLGLLVTLAGGHGQDLVYDPIFNTCVSVAPQVWHQWLPSVLEHGFYSVFLISKAMATPRSNRQAALGIIYRDGILFYVLTFLTGLCALLIWAFAPRIYVGLGVYPPWAIFQVGISRLLLNVKTSQIFVTDEPGIARRTPTPTILNMKDLSSQRGRVSRQTSYIVVAPGDRITQSRPEDEELGHGAKSHDRHDGLNDEDGGGESWKNVGREIHQVQSEASLRDRFWWVRGKSDIHVDVVRVEPEAESDGTGTTAPRGGVRESRLGRFDHWL